MSKNLLPHDAANLIPAMSDDEYQSLKTDISAHGQHEPIVVHDGKILDGRHRYRACLELGLKPRIVPWDGHGSIVTFVLSQNLHRRHLTASQRAAIAVRAAEMRAATEKAKKRQHEAAAKAGRASGAARGGKSNVGARLPQRSRGPRARDEVAQQFGTSSRYIEDAKTIQTAAPELLDQVARGDLTLPQAKHNSAASRGERN